jgi:hypothetical protein
MNYILKYSLFENTTIGLESSIMAHTQFNNMTNRLYPKGVENRQDDYHNKFNRETEFIVKNSKDIIDDKNTKNLLKRRKNKIKRFRDIDKNS